MNTVFLEGHFVSKRLYKASCHVIYCNIFMNEKSIGGLRGFRHHLTGSLQEAATYPTHDPVTPPPLDVPSSGALTIIGYNRGVRCTVKFFEVTIRLLLSLNIFPLIPSNVAWPFQLFIMKV